ncbi:MAG: phosphonate ABC transporter ATP-binding protein, partial [Enterococcus hulanensis]
NVLSGRLGYYSTWKSIFGLFTKEDYQQTKEALETVGLSDKLQTRSDELSGGQQQRVSIARALVQQAPIILADEPVASLDPITTQKVMEDLKKINQTMNKTVIVNLHSVPLAREFSTRVIALNAGQVVFDGAPEALTDERLNQIYGKAIFEEKAGEINELERDRSL